QVEASVYAVGVTRQVEITIGTILETGFLAENVARVHRQRSDIWRVQQAVVAVDGTLQSAQRDITFCATIKNAVTHIQHRHVLAQANATLLGATKNHRAMFYVNLRFTGRVLILRVHGYGFQIIITVAQIEEAVAD